MKKIFITAAAAMVLAGCSQTELEHTFVGQKEIRFSNLNDKVTTRAANDDNANYKVYAAWSGGTGWFINDEVSGTTDAPQNGPYYWPETGTVDFYAYAPATITATGTYPALSIAYTVPADADEDFTIATPETGLSSGTVALEFAHMLSKISITAALHQDLINAGYVLNTTGLTASLEVQSTGGTIVPTTTTPTWTSPNVTTTAYTGAASYMIMPQSSIGCKVQITAGIQITKNDVLIYSGDLQQYTIVAGNIVGDEFAMGKHYLLKLVIDNNSHGGGPDPENPDPIFNIITFSSDLADWDVVTPDPELPQP